MTAGPKVEPREAKERTMEDRDALRRELGARQVLLVDDDAFARELAQELLRSLGIAEVVTAGGAEEALAWLAVNKVDPDLVLCDLRMPGMDGVEFLRHLAERKTKSAVAVLSGSDRRLLDTIQNLAQARGLRFLGALSKPISEEDLVGVLRRLAERPPEERKRAPIEPLTVEEVREGLEQGRVEVFFQPKVAVPGRGLVGAECLARWNHPTRGLLSPAAFIEVAEANGLISKLTRAVFLRAVAVQGAWLAQGLDVKIAVNVSAEDLADPTLADWIAYQAERAGVAPERVTLEITESRLEHDEALALELISRLRLKGFGLSIDDFGTGYSTLAKLRKLPFTELKVDRAFVAGAPRDRAARAIFESSVTLGRSLDLALVAEGVETEAEWAVVRELGCHEAQGFLFAKPMAPADFLAWAKKNRV